MTHHICFLVIIGALTSANAHAATTHCKLGDLIREVTVVYADPGQPVPCEVLYEKPAEGQTQTLWRADNEAGFCEARAAEFVAKLETLQWTCTVTPDDSADETLKP